MPFPSSPTLRLHERETVVLPLVAGMGARLLTSAPHRYGDDDLPQLRTRTAATLLAMSSLTRWSETVDLHGTIATFAAESVPMILDLLPGLIARAVVTQGAGLPCLPPGSDPCPPGVGPDPSAFARWLERTGPPLVEAVAVALRLSTDRAPDLPPPLLHQPSNGYRQALDRHLHHFGLTRWPAALHAGVHGWNMEQLLDLLLTANDAVSAYDLTDDDADA